MIDATDPRMRFVIDADDRATAKIDGVNASLNRLSTTTGRASAAYTQLTEQDLAHASQWFDQMYGSTNKVTSATAAMGEEAEAAGRQTALAAERMSGGLMMVARSGEVSARGIRSLLGGATDLAFAFGPEGAWLTAIVLAGTALSEFWNHEQQNADKTAKEYQKVLDIIHKLSIGEQQATAGTAQAQVDAYNRSIKSLEDQMAHSQGQSAIGFAKEIEQVEKLRDAAQKIATEVGNNAARDQASRRYKQQADDMKQDISDLESRLTTAKQEAAEAKKNGGVGPEEDPAKLASDLNRKRAALRSFYTEEHAFMGVNLDDELQAMTVEARRYAQGESRAAQLRRFNALRQDELAWLKELKDANKGLYDIAEAAVKPTVKASKEYVDSIGNLPDGKDIAKGARDEIAQGAGEDPASKAIRAAYEKRQKIQDDANAKSLRAEQMHQRMMESVIRESIDGLVRAHEDMGRAILRAALEPEIKALEGSAAHEFAIAAKDLVTQNYAGAAMHAAGGAALIAGAKLVDSIAGGGGSGGSGYGGGAGGSGGGTPGTFRPTDQGQSNGSFTLNLITKHPASPDVVQSIAYELNRSNVLKRPPIQIPPTAGLQPFQG